MTPPPHRLKLESLLVLCRWRDPAKYFVAFEQAIEWLQLGKRLGLQGAAHSLAHEAPEPLSQAARLCREPIELIRQRPPPDVSKHVGRHEACLLQPAQIALAVLDPVDGGIDRSRNRVQKIKPERIGDEHRGGTAFHS